MLVESGKTYTCDVSDLKVYINKIYHTNEEYTKARITLIYKADGGICESGKSYKLYHSNIDHWYEVDDN